MLLLLLTTLGSSAITVNVIQVTVHLLSVLLPGKMKRPNVQSSQIAPFHIYSHSFSLTVNHQGAGFFFFQRMSCLLMYYLDLYYTGWLSWIHTYCILLLVRVTCCFLSEDGSMRIFRRLGFSQSLKLSCKALRSSSTVRTKKPRPPSAAIILS